MKKKYIPIIGTISAGKSTFLQGLLGTDLLETGSSTTTKFICIIKNSDKTKFYHILPKRKEEDIELIKEGNEIIEEEKIKGKIKEINDNLRNKPFTKDDIFYMLEIPIKNIENKSLLEECYLMDIPGLNENNNSYIDIIFSIITSDDIKFEIMVFDSTCIGQDSIKNILKKLEEMSCLKKTDNFIILNKIDKIDNVNENGEEEVINKFKQYFYENFEDDKNGENSIMINICENKFITMNSILFLAETKIEEFSSMLIVELFNYLNAKNKATFSSFYKYIKKKIEFNLEWLEENNKSVNLDINSISNEEIEIINKSIEELNNILQLTNAICLLDINLEDNKVKNNMIKLFILNKTKNLYYYHLKYYNKINDILKTINNNDLNFHP